MSTLSLQSPARRAGAHPSALELGWRWFRAAWRTSAQRNALMDLDDRTLADIGLDRFGARAEADRPFWDVPPAVWARIRDGGRF